MENTTVIKDVVGYNFLCHPVYTVAGGTFIQEFPNHPLIETTTSCMILNKHFVRNTNQLFH